MYYNNVNVYNFTLLIAPRNIFVPLFLSYKFYINEKSTTVLINCLY